MDYNCVAGTLGLLGGFVMMALLGCQAMLFWWQNDRVFGVDSSGIDYSYSLD